MATNKPIFLLALIFILVLIIPISHSRKLPPNTKTRSPFSFLKDLEGCHKGNKSTKGLHNLKHYLHQFGYLNYRNQTHLDDDDFDNALEFALKTYQKNYHVSPTGTLDAATVAKMALPRCGVADIVDGVNTMATKNHHRRPAKSIHTVANYAFFPNNPRWSASKTHLTYRFIPNTRTDAIEPVNSAFRKWASATHFTFSRVGNNEQSDLVVGFFSGNHGDGAPFDGRGRTIAHAFAPSDGRFHYDADEYWVNGAVQNAFDLETTALHEIGHLLGLEHSQIPEAIMFSTIDPGRTKGLHPNDIEGIKALYEK
ncbi:metalloendoproteinase 3-MMP-like [Andrographis paniculata]|uniref:metalloendoproteinase 3-MMP-like n=1 Tax=Andrographis paniculata TaxID=175694 RepID=UPI0021E949AC|nr:metalloendoproteinase 3-MMP-like [Andrographis paniculata]